jgi:hypothetical protein
MNIGQFKVEELSYEDQTVTTGGNWRSWAALLLYIGDEIWEGCNRPLKC